MMDQILADFRGAVAHDNMGGFCERYGIGELEWLAGSSQIELIAMVAHWMVLEERRRNLQSKTVT